MFYRILGLLCVIVGGLLVSAHFAIIVDPPPGVTWSGWRQYLDLIVGAPLFGAGIYALVKRRAVRLNS